MRARWQDYGDFSNGSRKVVLDQSVSMPRLAMELYDGEISVRRALMECQTSDEEIVEEARSLGALAVTMDRGFPRELSLILLPGRKIKSRGIPNLVHTIRYVLGVEIEPPKDYRRPHNGGWALTRELEYWDNIDTLRGHFGLKAHNGNSHY